MKTNAIYVVVVAAVCFFVFEAQVAFDFVGARLAAVLK